MDIAKEIELSVQELLQTLKASAYLCDQYGNRIESVQAVGTQLVKLTFTNNQRPLIEHVSQFRCFIA